jgi:hypothetical protein
MSDPDGPDATLAWIVAIGRFGRDRRSYHCTVLWTVQVVSRRSPFDQTLAPRDLPRSRAFSLTAIGGCTVQQPPVDAHMIFAPSKMSLRLLQVTDEHVPMIQAFQLSGNMTVPT